MKREKNKKTLSLMPNLRCHLSTRHPVKLGMLRPFNATAKGDVWWSNSFIYIT